MRPRQAPDPNLAALRRYLAERRRLRRDLATIRRAAVVLRSHGQEAAAEAVAAAEEVLRAKLRRSP